MINLRAYQLYSSPARHLNSKFEWALASPYLQMSQFFCAWPAFLINEEIHYCNQAKASSRGMGSAAVSAIGTAVSGLFEAEE